jgi:RNA polymerase sigma factor (sigma-70 family)
MDDRDIVAAIAAGDPAGLADAYDEHAESLYGYCRWMLSDPEDAAEAVQDTFVVAAERLGGLRDPRKLRPWLYAVARNECHRLGPAEADLRDADLADPPGPGADADGRAEVRRLVRAALDRLNPDEREVAELSLRHDLHGADLAAVLGVPRNRAHTLAARARGRLEKALGVLFVARTGRRGCPELDMLLGDWDGPMTGLTRRRVSHHLRKCDTCTDRRHGAPRAAARYGMAPLAALPGELREDVLGLVADTSPQARSYRREVTERSGPFRPNGFPEAIRPPRRRVFALSAAAVVIVTAVAATGIVAVLALSGSPARQPASADRSAGTAGAAGAPAGSSGGASPSPSPATSGPTVSAAPAPVAAPPSASPTKAKPSRPATSSAPASPPPRPTPTFVATMIPTSTPSATATPTSTGTSPPQQGTGKRARLPRYVGLISCYAF